jgi:hypothetical protein
MNKKIKSIILLIILFLFPILLIFSQPLIATEIIQEISIQDVKQLYYSMDETDNLLIVAPEKYQRAISSFREHKHNMNINTISMSTEYIYDNFNGGDNQEKIKNCIKDFYDRSKITSVLFIGDFKDIPVRYIYNDDKYGYLEPYFISDLYYADLYDEKGQFQTWDTNGNGIHGEWSGEVAIDYDISLTPEVALGRIPCSNIFQLRTMIDKIIDYETSNKDERWFNRFVVAGGDTYSEAKGNIGDEFDSYEGEILTAAAVEIMSDFQAVKLWASTGTLSTMSLINEITTGCGFLYLSGHGNPGLWTTNLPSSKKNVGLLPNLLIPLLRNTNKLPVCIVGACLNSKFDVHPLRIFYDNLIYFTWSYKCWSWALTSSPLGGSVATLGNTHLSWMDIEFGGGGSNWLELQFFREYVNGTTILGDIWKNAITSYVETFPIDWGTPSGKTSSIDAKTVQQWVLFGDPTLMIGGFPII